MVIAPVAFVLGTCFLYQTKNVTLNGLPGQFRRRDFADVSIPAFPIVKQPAQFPAIVDPLEISFDKTVSIITIRRAELIPRKFRVRL